jgi:hypothetical protein
MTVLVGSIFRWQHVLSLVIEYATEITAINPSAARFALMEMFDCVPVWVSIFGNVFAARNLHSSLFSFRSPGVLSSTSCSQMLTRGRFGNLNKRVIESWIFRKLTG